MERRSGADHVNRPDTVATADAIPVIDSGTLFEARSAARDRADQAITAAAAGAGFMTVTGLPREVRVDRAARVDLLRLFELPGH
jgi:isopenicillin N synthase-like dioxygenase